MAAEIVRQPLPIVLLNGEAVAGIIEASIESSSFFSADRFHVRAALSASGQAVWSSVPLLVEIRIQVDGQEASLISGNADRIAIDPIRGEIRVEGRDLASLFVGAQIDQSFENQTSSDVVLLLAQRRGLDAVVTATTAIIGRYYQNGRTRTALTQHARATTEWDLLCWLAQLEGFDIWVQGSTLYFQPVLGTEPSLTVTPQDCLALTIHHALDIAAGITVTVKSWDCLTQTPVMESVTDMMTDEPGVVRQVTRPNLSVGDAQSLAGRLLSEISTHVVRLDIEMPGDLLVMPRMAIGLSGTNTSFDGTYAVCAISRHIGFSRGYTQSIEARSLPWTAS